MSFCFRVADRLTEDTAETGECAEHVAVPDINHHKAMLKTAAKEEWHTLGPVALAKERALQLNRLSILQHRLIEPFTGPVSADIHRDVAWL